MRDEEGQLRKRLGSALKAARVGRGLTQAEVAELVETDPETISRFERGVTLPSLIRLLYLAEALGVTTASLLGGASPRSVDELEEVRSTLASLSPRDRRLATSVIRAVVSVWKP